MRRFRVLLGLLLLLSLVSVFLTQMPAYGTGIYGKNLPWGVERIHAQCLWDNNLNGTVDDAANAGQNVSIAVIDTGIDYWLNGSQKVYHPDLANSVIGGMTFTYNSYLNQTTVDPNNYHDDYFGLHGTRVAGIIAGVGDNVGMFGAAPRVRMYILKLATRDYREMAAAINYAANHLNVSIITTSIAFQVDFPALNSSCYNAVIICNKLLIAAAGNGNHGIDYPANYSLVVAVGATNKNDARWVDSPTLGSNFGPHLSFVAPGVDINSTTDAYSGGYSNETGTSFAAPFVAGTAALIYTSKSDSAFDVDGDGWENIEVWQKMIQTAFDLGATGKDNEYGYGLVNAWYANQRPTGDIVINFKVDLDDVLTVANAYGSFPGHPKWDPKADIIIDNKVDLADYLTVAINYGKVDP